MAEHHTSFNTIASLFLLLLPICLSQVFPVPTVEDQLYWHKLGSADIQKAMAAATLQNWGVAKNVIIFLGDGMGITPSTAGRIHKGQKKYGQSGEEAYLAWEHFPNVALMKTYNTDQQIPDSAATATAIFCGAKANFYTIGVDSSIKKNECLKSLNQKNWQESAMSWAQGVGKDTGFVTTTTVTHATPASLYAHVANRDWECNAKLGVEGHGCKDIAMQLIENSPGRDAKVIMGGGRQAMGVAPGPAEQWTCLRTDGRNLTNEWMQSKIVHGKKVSYVQNTQELMNMDIENTDYLMGLFAHGHMAYEAERDMGPLGQPSLANMTAKAIQILSKNNHNGFFLMVEGGRIDHALHFTESAKALGDLLAFDEAVETALSMVNLEETLIIVTADHSHSMAINGYTKRGTDILGVSDTKSSIDQLYFPTLMYTNGPNYDHFYNNINVSRPDASKQDTTQLNYRPTVAVPNKYESHGGEDVAAYAIGPMSHLLHSLHEQSYIAHVMGFSACMGPYKTTCHRPSVQFARFKNQIV